MLTSIIALRLTAEILHSFFHGSRTDTTQFIYTNSLVRARCGWLTEDTESLRQLRSRSFQHIRLTSLRSVKYCTFSKYDLFLIRPYLMGCLLALVGDIRKRKSSVCSERIKSVGAGVSAYMASRIDSQERISIRVYVDAQFYVLLYSHNNLFLNQYCDCC